MKVIIASDIHGSAYYCRKLLDAFEREGAERLILLGDILYHGPRNDLPRDYAPKKVIEMLNSVSKRLLCVRGNCDCEVDQMVLDFPVLADYAILDLGDRCAFLTHGHIYNLKNLPPVSSGDLLIHVNTARAFERRAFNTAADLDRSRCLDLSVSLGVSAHLQRSAYGHIFGGKVFFDETMDPKDVICPQCQKPLVEDEDILD
jgi:putative phosphoesterase